MARVLGEVRVKIERNYEELERVKRLLPTHGRGSNALLERVDEIEINEAKLHLQLWSLMVHAKKVLDAVPLSSLDEVIAD